MKKLFCYALLAMSILVAFSTGYAASPSVVGSWSVAFYLETTRSPGAIQCVVFKSVPGTVAGVPTSGTWTSPTFPGWTGQWVQLGDHVRWFGVTSTLATSAAGNMAHNNIFGGVSFNHFLKTNAATSTAGSFRATRVLACPASTFPASTYDPAL